VKAIGSIADISFRSRSPLYLSTVNSYVLQFELQVPDAVRGRRLDQQQLVDRHHVRRVVKRTALSHLQCNRHFSREAMAVEVDLTLPATRVSRTLERIAAWRGYPATLRLDNVPEFIALALAKWAECKVISLDLIQPGRRMHNGFIERLNGSFRRDALDMHVFGTLNEVREQAERWVADYNSKNMHDSLDGLALGELRIQNDPLNSHLAWH
jgi:putative transposase